MKKIFLLSKENLHLATAEVKALTNQEVETTDSILLTNSKFINYNRLAYTKRIYEFLFIAYKHNLENKIKEFKWEKIYKDNFAVRVFNCTLDEPTLGSLIWYTLRNPKVNLKNPTTEIHIIKKGSKFFVGKLIYQNKEDFESRKAHKRPKLHPTSLHPKLARCLVNLTGIQPKQTLLDPFCGSGGILIEAGLMNINSIGFDINNEILNKAKENIKHFKIEGKLEKKDALTIKTKHNYIATELPFGLNTPSTDLQNLYQEFLIILKKILKKQAVITFPHFINHKKLINKAKLKIKNEFDYYIHKSLTKKIVVLS